MKIENPNPRGWRRGDVFVDLARVVIAYAIEEHDTRMMYLVLRGSEKEMPLEVFTAEAATSLLGALEIYRSGR